MFTIKFRKTKRGVWPWVIVSLMFLLVPMLYPFLMDENVISPIVDFVLICGGNLLLIVLVQRKYLSEDVFITPQGIQEGKRYYSWNHVQKIQYRYESDEESSSEYLLFTFFDHRLSVPCDSQQKKQELWKVFQYIRSNGYRIQISDWTLQFKNEPKGTGRRW